MQMGTFVVCMWHNKGSFPHTVYHAIYNFYKHISIRDDVYTETRWDSRESLTTYVNLYLICYARKSFVRRVSNRYENLKIFNNPETLINDKGLKRILSVIAA